MKDFIFISDFDGTITDKDFYWILLDDYIGQKGIDYYKEWKKTSKIGTEFLNKVFTWHSFTDEERLEALSKVSIDDGLEGLEQYVVKSGGEFHICSAGFRYYIELAMAKKHLSHIHVVTNEGTFRNNTFMMEPDSTSPFYSEVYGVDKEKVALFYKAQCQKLYFAGDSEPDYWAARHADVIFAKHELAKILDQEGIAYEKYDDFSDILSKMKELEG